MSSCPRDRSKRCSVARRDGDGSAPAAAAWLCRPPDMEDIGADAGWARAGHLRRRAAGPGRAERRRDPAAAHLHHGSHIGHRDAFVHLLGRAVRRGHHVDPVQHSRRSLVGGNHLRRLPDGAAGQGRRSTHRGVHVVVHRFAGCSCPDHLSRAAHRNFRVAFRSAGIFRRLPVDLLFVRRPRARGQAQDHHLDDARDCSSPPSAWTPSPGSCA